MNLFNYWTDKSNKILFLFGISLGILDAGTAYGSAIGLDISGVKNTFLEASLVEFNITLFSFGGKTNPTDSVLNIKTSGDKEEIQLIVSGDSIDKDYPALKIKGLFGSSKIEGSNIIIDNAWWEYDFTVNLKDREASEGNLIFLDEVSVANGTIRHLEGPHKGDNDAGINLVWGDLSLIANATKVEPPNNIRTNSLKPPLDCQLHPGSAKHKDCITEGTLSGKVVDNTFGDDFENWRLKAGAKHIITTTPEPTSILSFLALGTLGAASTLKRKLKPSKSTEKETTKVS